MKLYMNPETGSVDTLDGWEHEDEHGNVVVPTEEDFAKYGLVELDDDDIVEEYQDWSGQRQIIELVNGTDVCFMGGGQPTQHETSKRWYRLWFHEGWGARKIFGVDDIDDMAERFGFDPARVNPGCDIALTVDDGGQIGGIVFDGWSA